MEAATDGATLPDHTDERERGSGSGSAFTWDQTQQVSPPGDLGLWEEAAAIVTYGALMEPRRRRWEERAASPGLTRQQRRYAARRAHRLSRPHHERVQACASTGAERRCRACPSKELVMYTCRQHLVCGRCRAIRARKLAAKIRDGVEAATRAIGRRRGLRWRMLTLTLRHSGDVAEDRRELSRSWRRFYKAMWKEWGDFAYCGTWELTPGRDELGHIHVHVLVLWGFRDYDEINAMWRRACPSSSHVHIKPLDSARDAAQYLAKYVSKGVDSDDFSPALRARALAGTYGTRWLFSSVRFWQPFVPCCPDCGHEGFGLGRMLWIGDAAAPPDSTDVPNDDPPWRQLRWRLE